MTQSESLQVGAFRIHYRRTGHGPPVVFLHGFFCDSRSWRWQFEAFSDEFTVVAWDNPGCGGSSDPPDGFTLAEYADVLEVFIRTLGLERPAVVGLSFGGALALELAHRHPGVPSALVVADGYAGWSGSFPPDVVQRRLDQSLPDLQLPVDEVVRRWIPGFLTPTADKALVDEVAAVIRDFHREGMAVMIKALAYADLRQGLSDLDAPVLLVWGDQDVRSPLGVGKDLSARIPGSRLVVLPGAGHLSNVEAAADFNLEVGSFLRSTLLR